MRLRRIRLERLPDTETRLKLIAANNPALPVVTWNVANVPQPEVDASWLNSNATDPMDTEPFAPRSDKAEIQYSKCTCVLAVGWCNCQG